ncbi:MAG: carboxypeptidase regulatory-like domain-containing protein [Gemmatimonadales bacterium]|nr:carboxypeptidase regulatory-like domain-containing protein [Gemmatimonadales bacterium]
MPRTRIGSAVSMLVGLLAAGAGSLPVAAAQTSSTDILTGVVTNDQGQPVADATVDAFAIESRITRSGRTNAKGRYTIIFPDGGGQYRLTVRFIGMSPVQRTVVRQADEDRIVTDIRLSSTPVQLQELRVSARQAPLGRDQPPTPGSTERMLPSEQVQRLPIDASDLLLLATLAPGVVNITGSDSTAAGFSVAGQRPTANNITLDGLTFGGASVPQDAVRNTRVITSSYDPARGQFSGGLVASTTRSGTNMTQGTFNYGFRDQALTVDAGDDAFATGFNQHQLSFGLGGPLIRNKLFVFGSGQGRFRGDDLQSLLSATSATLSRFGVAADSATRLMDLLRVLGVPIDTRLANGSRQSDSYNGLLRVDYSLGQSHTLTVRGDYRSSITDPTRIGPLSVPAADARSTQRGGGVMLTANSRFGSTIINELRAYVSGSRSATPAENQLPSGRVQVISTLDDALGATNLSFGGLSGVPQRSSSSSVEAFNEVSFMTSDAAHRIKLGGFINRTSDESDVTSNRFGTFSFNSLEDLEAGRPASYTRTLAPTIRATEQTTVSFYGSDTWRASDALQFTYGVRVEGSRYDGAPARNPTVEAAFGLRTDQWPSEWRVSPRVGFSWFLRSNDGGAAALVVRGGVGMFRSPTPTGLFSAAQAASGFGQTESQLVCVGPSAPIPDWNAYRADPASIPSSCLSGGPNPPPVTRAPSVTGFVDDFTAPRAVRTSLGVSRRVGMINLGAEASYSVGQSQFGVRDLNLGVARFTAAVEGRPVFAPAGTIDPRTGSIPLFASRKDAGFGNVLAFDSELQSRSVQLSLTANGVTRNGAFFNASYTWSRSRDQSSFSGGGAGRGFGGPTTAGDPNVREWARSDFDRGHAVLLTMTYPVSRTVELTTIARVTGGAPYTPIVGEDVNGDGSRNDRAFIFPAANADTAVANGMSRLLASTSGAARACLEKQRGTIAERNSCRGPWQPSLDFQLNLRPAWLGLNRRLMVSVVTSNFLVGLDQLAHGTEGIKGWGQAIRPDATLLVVRGFDPRTNAFLYTVNERFGNSGANTVAIRQPFQIGLQLRYTLGPDLMAQFRGQFGRGGGPGGGPGRNPGGGQGGPAAPGDFASRVASMMPNPAAEIVAIRIALNLTEEQVKRLEAVSDSIKARSTALSERARREIEKAGPNPDPAAVFGAIRPLLEAVRANNAWAIKESESILTPDQWRQVPDRIRSPAQGPGGGGQRGRPPA